MAIVRIDSPPEQKSDFLKMLASPEFQKKINEAITKAFARKRRLSSFQRLTR